VRPKTSLVLALAGLLGWAVSGCVIFPMRTRQAREGTVLDRASGAPVAGAEITVKTRELGFGYCGEPKISYVTRTDAGGRWRVPAEFRLRFLIAMPDAGYDYADAYEAKAPSGDTATEPAPCRYEAPAPAAVSRLRLAVVKAEPVPPTHSLTLGLVFLGDQRVSAYVGQVWFVAHAPLHLGLSAELRPGWTGGALGMAIVAMPRLGPDPIPFPGVALGFRYLRPWLRESAQPARFGPELSLFLLSLRFSVTAFSPRLGTPLGQRDYVVSAGFGYL
jgi:hypothetical protein